MTHLDALCWFGASLSALAVLLTARSLIQAHRRRSLPILPSIIDRDQLGQIEGRISDLSDVVVPCDMVERPVGALLDAVEHNMMRNVRYTFLVSQSKYESEKDSYFRIFKAIAEVVAKSIRIPSHQIENLIRIRPLRGEWNNFPFVFYKAKADVHNIEATIVYRGTERQRGICNTYRLVEPDLATTIYKLLVNSTEWDVELNNALSLVPEEFFSAEQYAKERLQ